MQPTNNRTARRQRILAGLRGRGLEQALADPTLSNDLRDEANSADPDKLVTPDLLRIADEARRARPQAPNQALFFSTDDVVILPGFLGSELVDAGPNGLIWIDPAMLLAGTGKLSALELAPFQPNQPDRDAGAGVSITSDGAVPVIYAGLKYDLEVRRYRVQVFGFDWRKGVEESAIGLADLIRDRANQRFRPLHLLAHSQGSLVARRALQLVGADLARQLVSNLVLLGPATAGTFSAAFAFAGNNSLIEAVRRYGIVPPPDFARVLQSMTGLYQLLPWRTDPVDGSPRDPALDWVTAKRDEFRAPAFWQTGVDADRLAAMFGWGQTVDASFLNDRTTIILGDHPTVGGVKFENGKLVEDPDFATSGDGTVPDSLARIQGVTRLYKAAGAEHMMLPATGAVIAAVRDVLAGRPPRIAAVPLGAAPTAIPFLADPTGPPPPSPPAPGPGGAAPPAPPITPPTPAAGPAIIADVSPPPQRRLRVFSFDPLFATELNALGDQQVVLELPWEFADGNQLRPGPVGEYLEVVDYDAPTGCFYPPVDLNHPHVLAQDGLPLSEGDPRFHQQMVYAVAMNTIRHFETALGRVALWAPHLERDAAGHVTHRRLDDEYVRQLRIYPHALKQANAYYDPAKKALLFGYFPATGRDVGRNLPGGTVFTCLSYDVVAHETTHALLDGLHRYFTQPSNADVFAFHEAFADVVALFQHFSHPEVLWHQIARTRGDLEQESMLGVLATQFGEAQGMRGALRQYLGRKNKDTGAWERIKPDPAFVNQEREPHGRGAILVAALFRAFVNIYENRVRDLRRIATGGTGILPRGDLHPDLVGRLAGEAAKSARHLLTMCIRALDYVPPVDITFGEYLRALITADYDLVKDDDRRYRVSVISAFRDWGIYPPGVRSLSVDSLLWKPPETDALRGISAFFKDGGVGEWNLDSDRRQAFGQMRQSNARFHDWLEQKANLTPLQARQLGLALGPDAPPSIRRGARGRPVFEVHSFRPCRRIGPDGQQRTDFVIELVQRRRAYFDKAQQEKIDRGTIGPVDPPDFAFRGGCTLVVARETGEIRYCVRKSVLNEDRLERERRFRQGQFGDAAGGVYLSGDDDPNPFRFLHGGG